MCGCFHKVLHWSITAIYSSFRRPGVYFNTFIVLCKYRMLCYSNTQKDTYLFQLVEFMQFQRRKKHQIMRKKKVILSM